jgi:transcriptional regulator with XRE-family HTH domain
MCAQDCPFGLQGEEWRIFYVFRRDSSKLIYDYRRMPVRRILSSNSTVGRRLRQARERAGLPQDRLGVLAGLEESSSSARISRYESGVHEPPLSFAEALAKVLGVPAAYFYCADERLAEIILHYASMSEAQRCELQTKAAELAGQ